MPPKTPRFITPSTTSQQQQPANPQQPPPRQPRFTPASSTPATAAPRSTPKFVSAPPSSSSSSQKRPLFRPPPPALPSTPTPASRLAFPPTAANEQIDSDIVTDSSPVVHPRKRRWEYEDDDDTNSPPPSSPPVTNSHPQPSPVPSAPSLHPSTTRLKLHRHCSSTATIPSHGGYRVSSPPARLVADEEAEREGKRKGGEVIVTGVRVEEGFIAVVGGEGEGLVLVGGREKGVEVGGRVVFEWPWWEVEVEGGMWRMCVFWAVKGGEGDHDDMFYDR
ncbi:hypothetical protein BDD12DRAFT_890133 [Trichophaea hybrida]|nr:hypothetical protein BDD12DRAFT_890133 [Trichophaea hybrida]